VFASTVSPAECGDSEDSEESNMSEKTNTRKLNKSRNKKYLDEGPLCNNIDLGWKHKKMLL
jgi:hypothetical protein